MVSSSADSALLRLLGTDRRPSPPSPPPQAAPVIESASTTPTALPTPRFPQVATAHLPRTTYSAQRARMPPRAPKDQVASLGRGIPVARRITLQHVLIPR